MEHKKLEIRQTAIGSVVNVLAMEAHDNAEKHGFYADVEKLIDHFAEQDSTEDSKVVWRDFVLASLRRSWARAAKP